METALSWLSPGELILFYMSIFIAIQRKKENKIIILDEPENHLHPKALLTFLDLLKKVDYNQLWIATHSLFLIPEFQFEDIIYIHDGCIQKRNSKLYVDIMYEMLEDREGKISQFFMSLNDWQYYDFISQCFIKPTVIDYVDPNDEQVLLFKRFLERHRRIKTFKVLDCGGGSGRLGLSIDIAQDNQDITANLQYDIFDAEPLYSGKKYRVYKDLTEIHEKYNCIVMMNFLHEYEPSEWTKLFERLNELLAENGFLFFVEVASLTKGEKPNNTGYLVLGDKELKVLFGDCKQIYTINIFENQKSICALIPKKIICNVNDETVQKSIKLLEEQTYLEIKSIRKEGKQKISVRRYAFLLEQYVNAKIFNGNYANVKKYNDFSESGNSSFYDTEISTSQRKNEKDEQEEALRIEREKRKKNVNKDRLKLYILSQIKSIFSPDTYFVIKNVINSSDEKIALKDNQNILWNIVLYLEKEHSNKSLISALLLFLEISGDQRATNRLENNRYLKYLPINEINNIEITS